MILSDKSIAILRNFATIRPTIAIIKGTEQKIRSPSHAIKAFATFEESFPLDCVIHDVPKFLHLLDNKTILDWKEDHVTIVKDRGRGEYYYANPKATDPPSKVVRSDLSNPFLKFNLPWDIMEEIQAKLRVLRYTTISFQGDGKNLEIAAVGFMKNVELPTVYKITIGSTQEVFRAFIDIEKLKLMEGDYEVTLVENKFAHFKMPGIEYFIALNTNSIFHDMYRAKIEKGREVNV